MSPTLFLLVLLAGTFWMGQFIWFPDGAAFLELFLRNATEPGTATERWAIQCYQETFAPDCGAKWVQRLLVQSSWASWVFLFALAVMATLSVANLLPKTPLAAGLALGDLLLYAMAMILLLLLLTAETFLLYSKGVPLSFRSRRAQWLAAHPAPEPVSSSGMLPWWFWLDSGTSETMVRVVVFLGGFLASVAALFYFSHLSAPTIITAGNFWAALSLWILTVTWLPIPLTIWLSHLDWTHRNREVLMLWASKQIAIMVPDGES
ncbi:hypothetical protein HFQ13_09665 [Acidithiobacillus sp. VAN18-1]|uniref:Uncharacterized protein n=1 Tax=Igneacidithiobacillus copahuensis TaxID=2724909 RepID=A0AAE2YQE5_9PROT|nr:hypothetical protein [Igneacidithiobacillus copahuensis]MBU2788459.1 hypothetical protein [Igneacidithiobacillus copahuensis]MBU2796901.1 hypothetical protein [Acidithiobacillus sp. VAN18-2]